MNYWDIQLLVAAACGGVAAAFGWRAFVLWRDLVRLKRRLRAVEAID